jgi:hypothetical protein
VRLTTDADRREVEQSGLFDAAWYIAHAPDAARSGLDPLDHYLTIGGRAGHSPGPHFDAAWYLRRYNSVAAAQVDPLLHYIRFGRRSGRLPRPPVESLFDDFQSLGSNCEFGLVQRHFGSEMLGLLRFATTPMRGLLPFLRMDADPFTSPEALEVSIADSGEYNVTLEPCGIRFHTDLDSRALAPDEARSHEARRLSFLWRKFAEDLEEGGRIFVYKSGLKMSPASIAQLLALLRRRAPNHLLWVTPPESGRAVGTVEIVAPGLMRGTIDRLSADPSRCSYDLWKEICSRAHGLRRKP